MRMTPDQLLIDRIERIADIEQLFFGSHLREENGLQHEVAKLGAQLIPIAPVDRVEHLVGLFERVGFDGIECLLAIPGTPSGSPQPGHDLNQPLKLSHPRHLSCFPALIWCLKGKPNVAFENCTKALLPW